MAEPAPPLVRYEDHLTPPEHWEGEILGGQLHTHPRPPPRHAWAYSLLSYTLGGPISSGVGGPSGRGTSMRPRSTWAPPSWSPTRPAGGTSASPHAPNPAGSNPPGLGVHNPLPCHHPHRAGGQDAPLCPGGGGSLWLVDPDARTLEVYRLHQDPWPLLATLRETDPVQQPPFEALGFPHGSRLA